MGYGGRNLHLVDTNTGELVPRVAFGYGPSGFGTFSLKHMQALAEKASGRTDGEVRVVAWYCGATLAEPNEANRSLSEIAGILGITRPALSRMVARLVKDRLLRKGATEGRVTVYEVTPYLAFRGSGAQHRERLKEWEPPHIAGLTDDPQSYLTLVLPEAGSEPNFLQYLHLAGRPTTSPEEN